MTDTTGQTCIHRTYNDKSEPVDYERTNITCTTYSNIIDCNTVTYNDQNTQTGWEREKCFTNYATWDDGECTPTGNSDNSYLTTTRSENGNKIEEKRYCYNYENGTCGTNEQSYTEYFGNSSERKKIISTTCNGVVNADYTCNDGEWRQSDVSEQNAQQKGTRSFDCRIYNTENTCLKPSGTSFWDTYADDGVTRISHISLGDGVHDENNPNITFITYDPVLGQNTNTVTCAKADADWETGTCKPGTAIES